ncbi:hypothetical protein DNH61_07770 [Paenibacillus sambharensis]|uniref:Uncharacterized protein n=1 Tax=Paenibacillus sambharensis TaxID=1803190 RepID=A0A2W1LCH6_9BACL|nr:hypothetical protein [Paenibacillus sambharensis]PZD96399.1 hypothetical protein DNH61_07770 [Paenibacillus sambharensis]
MTISKQEAERRARTRWDQWRLLLAGMVTYRDLLVMDQDDVMEANAALDLHIRQQEKKSK